jgi:hypothetical protein
LVPWRLVVSRIRVNSPDTPNRKLHPAEYTIWGILGMARNPSETWKASNCLEILRRNSSNLPSGVGQQLAITPRRTRKIQTENSRH